MRAPPVPARRGAEGARHPIAPVDQNARAAPGMPKRAFVMETGRVTLLGSANQLPRNPQVRQAWPGA
jgi:ABC-type branched-subunit amino acid transport system ATPase component